MIIPVLLATLVVTQSHAPDIIPDAPKPAPAPAPTPMPTPEPVAAIKKEKELERVAVYDFDTSVVEKRIARIVTDSVVAELRKLQGISVVSMDEVRAMLEHESNKALLGCSQESCVAEIADALGVDTIIVGNLTRVGDESIIGLRRLDQRAAAAVGTSSRRLAPQNGEEFLAAIGPIVQELFPDAALRPGQTRGVDQKLALRMNPPPVPSWATLSAGAMSLLLAGGAAASAVGLVVTQDEYRALGALSVTQEIPGTQLVAAKDRGELFVWTTNGLMIGALTGAITTGVLVPWTDWAGTQDDEAP